MNFLERARILAERGVPVAPALTGDKRCVLQGWPEKATLDPAQIQAWSEVNPDANTAAVCLDGGTCVLDADNEQFASFIFSQKILTFTVLSGGRNLPHFYFKHTPESTAFGNCKIMVDGVLWADFQANRKYVIGPGSQLANGGTYRIVCNDEIQPMPSSLLEWITVNGIQQKPAGATPRVSKGSELSEEFDFEAFCKHFNITGHWKGSWFLVDWCPVSGFPHNGSKHTGIYFDGNRLGFHCFAASCEGSQMSFGQVLRHLNSIQEPYRGPIWKDESEKWLKNWRRTVATV